MNTSTDNEPHDWDAWVRQYGRKVLATQEAGDDDGVYFQTGRDLVAGLLHFARPAKFERAHEIGCGDAHITLALTELFTKVSSNDVSSSSVEQSATRLEGRDADLWVGGSASMSKLANDEVDLIISVCVMQHVDNAAEQRGYVVESCRAIAKGGAAMIQFRQAGLVPKFRDAAVDLARVVLRRPAFTRMWRGNRATEADILSWTQGRGVTCTFSTRRWHTWAIITKPL